MSTDLRLALSQGRIRAEFTMMDVLGHLLIWAIITVVTLGIGIFFWPYAACRLVLNGIAIYDASGARLGRLRCNLSAGQQIGHILLWTVLSLVTVGLAVPFYLFGVVRTAVNSTDVV